MNRNITCDDTQTIIDRLSGGTATEAERAALRAHAAACPDCAMLVRIHEHCADLAGEDLGAAMPRDAVNGMWRSVRERIEPPRAAMPRWRRAVIPALAAAVVVLIFACGYLLGELRQLRGREGRLVSELAASRQTLDVYRRRAPAMQATRTGMTGAGLATAAWRRALPAQDEFSVAEIVALLEALPADASILPAGSTLPILGGPIPLRGAAERACRRTVDMDDGLQAGEAVTLAKCLALDPGARIERERLITIIENIYQKGVRS